MGRRIGIALIVAVGVTGCGDGDEPPISGRGCTEIGCDSGVYVEIPQAPKGARKVTLCVDQRCRTSPIRGHAPFFAMVRCRAEPDTVRVLLAFRDPADNVLRQAAKTVTLRKSQPNGAGCPPICWQASFTYQSTANRLMDRRV